MTSPASRSPSRLATIAVLLALILPQALAAQTVHGQLEDEGTGEHVSGVEVRLMFGDAVADRSVSDTAGAFQLAAAQSGEHTLSVAGFGYAEVNYRLRLLPGEEVTLRVRMAPQAVELEPVVVVARRGVPTWLREFHHRAGRNQASGRGKIYMRQDLERMGSTPVRHILFTIPSRNCRMSAFLDGLPTDMHYIREFMTADDLEGLEIYRTTSHIPMRYQRPGMCGAVLAWSRTAEHAQPWSLKRVLIGSAIFLGILLIR